MTTSNRILRELDGRTEAERPKSWTPASILPEPDKQPGYSYRWIRVSTSGQSDPRNISSKTREGWEPVSVSEQKHLSMLVDPNSRFKDNIEIAGLLLCKMPSEFVEQRNNYFAKKNKDQMASVDNSFMRENDPRMPLFAERKTTRSFGKGN